MSAKPLYGTRTAATVTLNSLANGAIANSSEYNNSTGLFMDVRVEVNAAGSNAGETGYLIVYAREGLVTGTLEDDLNLTRIGSIKLNGTAAVRGVLVYEKPTPFFQLSFKQQSSSTYALGTGCSAYTLGENIQDV